MKLTDLISKLQHLATFVDNPQDIDVCVYSDFHEDLRNIKLVDFDSPADDFLCIVTD